MSASIAGDGRPSGTPAAGGGELAGGDELVSCIIIFLDEERFLAEAVRSVFDQSHDSWELILVDDGSSDGSTAIARRWAAERPERVRYVEHPGHANAGMSASRNLGLAHSSGSYVAFLDADDVWLPHKLEEQLALMRAHPEAGMVCGATELWSSWAGGGETDRLMEVGTPFDSPLTPSPLRDVLVPPPLLSTALYPLGRGFSPSTSNFLLRRTVVDQVGGYEAAFHAMYEDQAFQSKVYLHAPVYVATAVWDRYRQHAASSSATSRSAGRTWRERGRFLRWFETYLARQEGADPSVRRALAEALWPFRHPLLYRLRELAVRLRPRRPGSRSGSAVSVQGSD